MDGDETADDLRRRKVSWYVVLGSPVVCFLLLCLLLLGGCGGSRDAAAPPDGRRPAAAADTRSKPAEGAAQDDSPPWRLSALSADQLDRVRRELGGEAGLLIADVSVGGAGEGSDIRANDILIAMDGAPVRTEDEVERALRDHGGAIALTLLRASPTDEWVLLQREITMAPTGVPGAPGAPPASPPSVPSPSVAVEPPPVAATATTAAGQQASAPAPPEPVDTSVQGCVRSYFAMLDFCRARAWGRSVSTPPAVLAAATNLMRQCWSQLAPPVQAAVHEIPTAWVKLQQLWSAATPAERARQCEVWRNQLLLPNPLLPQLASTRNYEGCRGRVGMEVPVGWITAEGEVDGDLLLFVAPPGTEASWQQVIQPATAPPGVLFVVSQIDEDLRVVPSAVAGARLVAARYVTAYAPGLREIAAFDIGPGAVVVLRGPAARSGDESFCWVGSAPLGGGAFLAVRFLAPVARAETLLPPFSALLSSLEFTQVSEEASLGVSLAASMIGNAVVNSGWQD